ncbi:MAG: procyclic acidic repetitive family protein [Planctomycetota bacterium]|nr:procyclic acidic repetitive family protein [Planctomycetota bacterium]
MISRLRTKGFFLLLPVFFGLAGCNSLEKPREDLSGNKDYVRTLDLPGATGEVNFRRYPFTLAIAPPVFDFRIIKNEDGNDISLEVSKQEFEEPFEPTRTGRFTSVPMKGAGSKFLTANESRILRDNKLEKAKADEAEPEATPSVEPEKQPAVEPKKEPTPSVSPDQTPVDPRPRRRIRLGQGRSRPLGINSELFERELNSRLYGPDTYQGYGGSTGNNEKKDAEKKDESKKVAPASGAESEANLIEPPKKQSFIKDLPNDWDAPNATDQKVAELNGYEFQFNPNAYTSRMKAVLDQFAVFEEIKELSNTGKQFENIREAADVKLADFVMTTRVKRFKVAYHGVTALWYANSLVYATLWWPSLFVADEEFRLHFEVSVDINDVRSRTNLFHKNFVFEKDVIHSDLSRGWFPFSQYFTPTFQGESTYRTVAQKDLAAAIWQSFEEDLLREVHTSFRATLNAKNFEDKINDGVVGRSEGLVVGINKYGPKAHSILEQFHRQSLASVVGKDKANKYPNAAVRPYAQNDAKSMGELMSLGADVAVKPAYLTRIYNNNASRDELMTAIHRLTRARREDRTFVYLNLETVVVDVDTKYSSDGLAKYLLPYDCDLQKLERKLQPLRVQLEQRRNEKLTRFTKELEELQVALNKATTGKEIKELQEKLLATEEKYKAASRMVLKENQDLFQDFSGTCMEFFDKNAISFAWLETQFNKDPIKPLEDHVSLHSKNALFILDATFPGQFTDLNYSPAYELSLGYQPFRKGTSLNLSGPATSKEPEPAPKEQPKTEPEPTPIPKAEPLEVGKDGKEPKDGKEAAPKRRRIRLGSYFEALRSATMNAGSKKDDAKASGEEERTKDPENKDEQVGISPSFLKILVRPGVMFVVTSMGTQRPLEFAGPKAGAFVYHFVNGTKNEERVSRRSTVANGQLVNQVRLTDVLSYIARRVGQQSNALGSPQEFGFFRQSKNDDFVLIQDSRKP